jgi:AraC-like DNA-binding protein
MKVSFPEFRNQKRVEYAIQLFKEKKHHQMSIEGISDQCGFKSKSSFYLAFRAVYQMTPTEWIAQNL